MTDSGFSSATSQRSKSSTVGPEHTNSFSSSSTPNLLSIPSPAGKDGGSRKEGSPKPSIRLLEDSGNPTVPNRATDHDCYSPGLSSFSSQGMSPISSLASNFKDLHTRYDSSMMALKKRLSLSSVSSFDSPHPPGSFLGCSSILDQVSASSSSISLSNELSAVIEDAGVQRDMRRKVLVKNCLGKRRGRRVSELLKDSEGSICEAACGLYFRPIQEEECFSETRIPSDQHDTAQLGKQVMDQSRREKSREDVSPLVLGLKPSPAGKVRLLRGKGSLGSCADSKENEFPNTLARRRLTADSEMVPSPLGLSASFSPIGSAKTLTRPLNMMSSPFVTAKSSAFEPVPPAGEALSKTQRTVLGAIDSNIPHATSRQLKRPSKPGVVERVLPAPDQEAGGKRCIKSSNAKSAFLPERKTKSVDAVMGGRPLPSFAEVTSPISKQDFAKIRAVSAPLPAGDEDDDDYVLSRSSLCDLDDEDGNDGDETKNSSGTDDAIEQMMSENMRFSASAEQSSTATPSALGRLMSGALLLGNSVNSSADSNDSLAALGCRGQSKEVLKPRELFRSPSAPPIVPSRRVLALKRAGRNAARCSAEDTPLSIKRPRTYATETAATDAVGDSFLNRSHSYNELDVMKAVDQGCADPTLVGDFTRSCTLPFVDGRKQDLKYITAETLVEAMDGRHDVGAVEVVDCRYTYEYDGGHVQGAVNVWTEGQLVERYFNCTKPMWAMVKQQQAISGETKPHILVFHCEFSSERAPKLARYLRNYDRTLNAYPKLHYPEFYVLKDGYREFYKVAKEHCEPRGYVPMSHEGYAGELRKFRTKSKTWAGENSKKGLVNKFKHQ